MTPNIPIILLRFHGYELCQVSQDEHWQHSEVSLLGQLVHFLKSVPRFLIGISMSIGLLLVSHSQLLCMLYRTYQENLISIHHTMTLTSSFLLSSVLLLFLLFFSIFVFSMPIVSKFFSIYQTGHDEK